MIDLDSASRGYLIDVPIVAVGDDPPGDIVGRCRTAQCKVIGTLLNAGMAVSAVCAADRYGVQFNPRTVRRWSRGDFAGPSRARRTYAHLLLGVEVDG